MGPSTTIKNDKELKVCGYSRALDLRTSRFLKIRKESKVGLVFWTGPGIALEILRL